MTGKRRERLANMDFLATDQPKERLTFEDADASLFSGGKAIDEVAKKDAVRQVAKPVSIFDIVPDFSQPRRAMPSSLRTHWDGNPESLGGIFKIWIKLIKEERQQFGITGDALDLLNLLQPENAEDREDDRQPFTGPLESAFREIVQLAISIRREGLTNPITAKEIRQQDSFVYRLETGERRWLAYHLLNHAFGGDTWTLIPVRTVQEVSVWRQAAENTARQDLNAIGKARQFAVLAMHLFQQEEELEFARFDAFEHERQYYAQILPINRTPYGKRKLLLQAMGLKSPAELTRCRDILALPDAVWTLADDLNASQAVLLECVGKSEEEALQIVSSWNDSESPIDEQESDVDSNTTQESTKARTKALRKPGMELKQNFGFLIRAADKSDKYPNKAPEVFERIDAIRRWLDEVEEKWRRKQDD